jgi:enamine deaminase RidA (YjgF/YER057c/UK114 family)
LVTTPAPNLPLAVPPLIAELQSVTSEVKSVGWKLVDSLQEVVDDNVEAIVEVVQQDSKEVVAALGELMQSICHQTTVVVEQSKDKAQLLREGLQHRNDRARGKAKEIRGKGERLVSLAEQLQDELKSRTNIARHRARRIKKRIKKRINDGIKDIKKNIKENIKEDGASREALYSKVLGEWTDMLKDKVFEGMDGKRRRGKRRGKPCSRIFEQRVRREFWTRA